MDGIGAEDPEVRELRGTFANLSVGFASPEPSAPLLPEPDAEPPAASEEAESEASGSSDTSWESWHSTPPNREPTRFYAVWKIPNNRTQFDFIGIHSGVGTAAYEKILWANNRVFEGIRFCRAPTLEAAKELFRSEAVQHGVDPAKADTVYQWA